MDCSKAFEAQKNEMNPKLCFRLFYNCQVVFLILQNSDFVMFVVIVVRAKSDILIERDPSWERICFEKCPLINAPKRKNKKIKIKIRKTSVRIQ